MTWTYTLAQLGTSPLFQVRRLIGDVISTDQQVADEEINFFLTTRPSIYGAAAETCRAIAAQYSRKADVVVASGGGNLKQNYSIQAKAYLAMATQFESKAATSGSGMPYAGGISISDKQSNEQDSDRVAPQFNIGMEDNYLPEGPVGNENAADVPSTTGTS